MAKFERGVIAVYQRSDGIKKRLCWVTALMSTLILLCNACAGVIHLFRSYITSAHVNNEEFTPLIIACSSILLNGVMIILAADEAWRVRPELGRSVAYVAICMVTSAICITQCTASAVLGDILSAVWSILNILPLACFAVVYSVAIHMCLLRARLAAARTLASNSSINDDSSDEDGVIDRNSALLIAGGNKEKHDLSSQEAQQLLYDANGSYGRAIIDAVDPDDNALTSPLQRRLINIFRLLSILLLFIGSISFVVSSVCLALDQVRLKPEDPPHQVPIDLYQKHSDMIRMYAHCEGNRSETFPYTVVLEHSEDFSSTSMMPLQSVLAGSMRTCVYDRAGSGWSDRGANIVNDKWRATQMVWLLNNIGEGGPFIIGGHGDAGARLALAVYAQSPENVAGIMIFGGNPLGNLPDKLALIHNTSARTNYGNIVNRYNVLRFLSPFGLSRFFGPAVSYNISTLPERYQKSFLWNLYRPGHANSMFWYYYARRNIKVREDIPEDVEEKMPAGWMNKVPLLVVTTAQDPTNVSCKSLGADDGTEECELLIRENKEIWKNSHATKSLSNQGTLVPCEQPCSADSLVWDHIDFLIPHIEAFLFNVTSSST